MFLNMVWCAATPLRPEQRSRSQCRWTSRFANNMIRNRKDSVHTLGDLLETLVSHVGGLKERSHRRVIEVGLGGLANCVEFAEWKS